eukprot:6927347-Pyramimonas_sp.AAC.1
MGTGFTNLFCAFAAQGPKPMRRRGRIWGGRLQARGASGSSGAGMGRTSQEGYSEAEGGGPEALTRRDWLEWLSSGLGRAIQTCQSYTAIRGGTLDVEPVWGAAARQRERSFQICPLSCLSRAEGPRA